jgi:hypothetical protein
MTTTPKASPPQDAFSARLAQLLNGAQPGTEVTPASAATQAGASAAGAGAAGAGPVGQGDYVVKQGDCTSSIAKETGYFWETIWNDPANAELKAVRKNPNVLLPGDRVTIPEKQVKKEPGETEMRHRFVRKGEPAFLRLRLLEDDIPLANLPYTLTIGDAVCRGTTDAEGKIDFSIPGNAETACLELGSGDNLRVYQLRLGYIDPEDALTGIQHRLNNLGFGCGEADGVLSPRARAALKRYQAKHRLTQSGIPDAATKEHLRAEHGC